MSTLDAPSSPSAPQPPIWNTVSRFGAICALALVVYSLMSYLIDIDPTAMSTGFMAILVSLGLAIGLSVMAIRHQRVLDGGYMTYGRGLLIAFCVTFIAAFLANIWNYVLVNFIDPDYVLRMKESFVNNWGEAMPSEAMEEALAGFDKMSDLGTSLKNGAIYALVLGLFAGLIAAAFGMKSRPVDH